MVASDDFATNFGGRTVPEELQKLLAFQTRPGRTRYADGFELVVDDKEGLRSWSEEAEFLDALMPFAQANGTGSFHALWVNGPAEPGQLPVVIFGDEGGVHIVAENVRGLLQMLTFDSEPSVSHAGVSFFKEPDTHRASKGHADYETWLKTELGLDPVDDPTPMIERAQASLQAPFEQWMRRFYADE
jgi:hypothetical protein